ncbi:MAG: Ig-like domain-containing protein, partial [Nitrososphaeraceae archaeon]
MQITSTNLGDGTHTLQIKAEDKVGNRVSSPASFNWTIDTVPSTAKIDSVVDGNKSAVANDGSTKSTSMTFTFSGNDTGGVGIDHFECSIDNSDFVTCTSPFTSPGQLKDGAHTFRILSQDNVGNRGSSPQSFSWIVDTVSPSTMIDSIKDGNNNSINTGGNSSSNSVIVSFSGIDTGGDQDKGVGINHFECSVDGAAFSNCSTPMKLDKLTDGSHTIEIRSSDNVGNDDASPASFIWTIDTVPPNTSFSSVIDGNRNAVAAGGNTLSTSMTFTFSGTDTGSGLSLFECSLDGAPFVTCESPIDLNNLADGSHTFEVRSEDNVVNRDQSPASFNWTIDTSAPTTSIDTVVDSNKNSLSNSSNTRSNSITFTFSGNDTGKAEVKRFECSTDNSDFVACTSPFGFPNLLSDGSHTFKVRAEDNSGNKDASAEIFSWNVDTTPPPADINSAFDGNNDTVSNGGNTTSTSITFTFSGTDIGIGLDHFECSIDGASFTICASPVQFNSLSDGSHTLEVRAADKVGNEGPTPTAFVWTVNTTPPNTSINSATDGNKNIVANNSNTRSNTITILFSASEVVSNVDHVECSIDNSDFVTCTSPYTFPNLLADGTHTFKARAEDKSGHEDMSPALYTWTVDTGAPTTTVTSATDSNRNAI